MTGPRFKPAGIESLTPNELKVLKLVAEGLDNKEMAYLLGVKKESVPIYLRNIYQKLGIDGKQGKRFKLIVYAIKELRD